MTTRTYRQSNSQCAAVRHRVVRWQAEDRELEDLFMDFYRDAAEPASPRTEESETTSSPEHPANGTSTRPPASTPVISLRLPTGYMTSG